MKTKRPENMKLLTRTTQPQGDHRVKFLDISSTFFLLRIKKWANGYQKVANGRGC